MGRRLAVGIRNPGFLCKVNFSADQVLSLRSSFSEMTHSGVTRREGPIRKFLCPDRHSDKQNIQFYGIFWWCSIVFVRELDSDYGISKGAFGVSCGTVPWFIELVSTWSIWYLFHLVSGILLESFLLRNCFNEPWDLDIMVSTVNFRSLAPMIFMIFWRNSFQSTTLMTILYRIYWMLRCLLDTSSPARNRHVPSRRWWPRKRPRLGELKIYHFLSECVESKKVLCLVGIVEVYMWFNFIPIFLVKNWILTILCFYN